MRRLLAAALAAWMAGPFGAMGAQLPPVSSNQVSGLGIPATGAYTGRTLSDSTALLDALIAAQTADPDAQALFARMQALGTRVDIRSRLLISAGISGLKAAGLWAKLDVLYVFGMPDANSAVLNWKSTNYTATISPSGESFSAGLGFKGDGASGYINSNFNPTTAVTPNFTQNSASLGVWPLEDIAESNKDDAGNTAALIRTYNFATSFSFRLNSTGSQASPSIAKQSFGLTWVSRSASTGYTYGHNGQTLGTITDTSTTPSNDTILFNSGRVSPSSSKRLGLGFIGGAMSSADMAAFYGVMAPVVQGLSGVDTFTLSPATTFQTMDGLGFELQSDSIEGDAGGIQQSDTASIPLDLTASERVRLAQTIASVPGGGAFDNFRLAMGLYYRGITSDGKNFTERLTGQNAAIKKFISDSGVRGIAYLQWSPAPFYKRVTINGTTYSGGTTSVPNQTSDPNGYNTYLRNMLQGGGLDAPDKTANPTAYAAWMDDFSSHVLADMEYVHTNVGRVVKFSPQNEPATGGTTGTYPACVWTAQQMYDFLKVIVPKIRASAVLSTYNGQANRVDIYMDAQAGQTGIGSALIAADPSLLSQMSGWAWHDIDRLSVDAGWARVNAATRYNLNTSGLPVFSDENEYFDTYLTPGTAQYLPPAYRFANTVLQPMMWFLYENSTIWYWIHIGKPSTGPASESQGRSLTVWKPPGSAASTTFPSLTDGTFTTVAVNWNAIKPWLRFMPKGSVRVGFSAALPRNDVAGMAWTKPNGKLVFAVVNRSENYAPVQVGASSVSGSFVRNRYDAITPDQVIETVSLSGGVNFTVPPYSAEFWEQQ
jgi:hypothetical protein